MCEDGMIEPSFGRAAPRKEESGSRGHGRRRWAMGNNGTVWAGMTAATAVTAAEVGHGIHTRRQVSVFMASGTKGDAERQSPLERERRRGDELRDGTDELRGATSRRSDRGRARSGVRNETSGHRRISVSPSWRPTCQPRCHSATSATHSSLPLLLKASYSLFTPASPSPTPRSRPGSWQPVRQLIQAIAGHYSALRIGHGTREPQHSHRPISTS
ncbi:hypothetical protein CC80DRAFT_508710 [Byssothecium circinans]|uniref:Uncharacterized protein n=1 Tax=Byssothecium circinans TaxID=147558 RepID=A0A6A5TH81_9PLEO|nr:hypothetical protein CC80DRAFT_508710 [Byssothecium circinans]